jgi:hypothetical protein
MQAFQSWLCKHAQHVQFLDVDVSGSIPSADRGNIKAALQQSLLLYGATGQDRQLKLVAHSMFDNTHWLASMTKLCHADMECRGFPSMLVTPDITGATSLHTLRLSGNFVIDEVAQLPASLTRLELGECGSFNPAQVGESASCRLAATSHTPDHMHHICPQVALLTNLEHWDIRFQVDTYDLDESLAHLGKLTALCLDGFQELPDSLSSLPHLKRLDLADGNSI